MVNELVEPGEAIDAALALAERIAPTRHLPCARAGKVVAAALTEDDDTLWNMGFGPWPSWRRTEDFAEGPRAFIEKRPPKWKGR